MIPKMQLPETEQPHQRCKERIVTYMREIYGFASDVTGRPPTGDIIVASFRVVSPPFEEACFRCPHGVDYWVAPDAQLQQWILSLTETEMSRWNHARKPWDA